MRSVDLRVLGVAGLALVLAGCGGSGGGPATGSRSVPPASTAAAPACAPLHQFFLAGRLLGQQLQGTNRRAPAYLQRVVDTGVSSLQQTKATASPSAAGDAGIQLQYWTAVRSTLAGDGFDVAKVTSAQDDAIGTLAQRIGSAPAAGRLQTYATTTCGSSVLPTAQQLADFG